VLPAGAPPITSLAARDGVIGSEELAQALQDASRLCHCVWLRLDATDGDPGAFSHAIAHAADRPFPGMEQMLAQELGQGPEGAIAPEELAIALGALLPDGAVVVLEDVSGAGSTRTFARFGRAWATSSTPLAQVIVVVHGRPGRHVRATAPVASWPFGRGAGVGRRHAAPAGPPTLPPYLLDRLVRLADGRSALVSDVVDAASAERCDLVAEAVVTAHGRRDLMAGVTERLLSHAGPVELDVLRTASRLGYWHPDLGSSVDAARLRPWMLPLEHEWHWLRPFWAGPLASGLGRVVQGPSHHCRFDPDVVSPAPVDYADRSRVGTSRPGGRATIVVRMLGAFELAVDGRDVTAWPGNLGPSVLKYLLAQPKRASPRDVLLDTFWPSVAPALARNRLQVALTGVRRKLEAVTPVQLIEFRDGAYRVSQDVDVDLDVDTFERLVECGRHDELDGHAERAVDHLSEAVAVYRGDFLADSPYADWTTLTRETLRIKYLDLLDRLARLLLQQDRTGECIGIAQRILSQDPSREDAHRLMMYCFSRQGRTHQALRQFDLCRVSLREALGVRPSKATLDLYQKLRGLPDEASSSTSYH
jgi:DNA-binding SARP family transcriptional activator